jgi:hypothetical protein
LWSPHVELDWAVQLAASLKSEALYGKRRRNRFDCTRKTQEDSEDSPC